MNTADGSHILHVWTHLFSVMFTHHAVQSFAFHPLGVWCLGSRRADWLPSDAAVSLCTGRFGLWSLCQQREAGGNRPQGQKKGCSVGARRPLRPSIIAVYLCHYYQVTPFAQIFTNRPFLSQLPSLPFYSMEPAGQKGKKASQLFWTSFLVLCQKRKFAVAWQHPFVRLYDPL